MARHAENREDLMRDAVALVERVEFQLVGRQVIIGFRREGAGSLYLDQDPAYHFNSHHELRRALVADLLYKAESGRLIALRRERSDAAVIMRRHELNRAETQTFLAEFEVHRSQILHCLHSEAVTPETEIPAGGSVKRRAMEWLARLSPPLPIARSARVA